MFNTLFFLIKYDMNEKLIWDYISHLYQTSADKEDIKIKSKDNYFEVMIYTTPRVNQLTDRYREELHFTIAINMSFVRMNYKIEISDCYYKGLFEVKDLSVKETIDLVLPIIRDLKINELIYTRTLLPIQIIKTI